ncbi:glyoxalase superfamily protein [Pseudomonas shirazica]|uniref:glyoxalase superfamily protein n=1 Tax=Pseudomonas shirazica TaxID=1940636 RepID=UPI003525900D
MSTIETLKIQAKRLRAHLARHNMPVTHSQSLEAVAAIHGHRDWNTALAALTRPPTIQAPLLLEVTQDSTPEHLHSSLQSLLRLAPEAIRFQLASNVSEEMVRVAQDLAAQIERAGTTVIFEGTVRPHVSTLRPTRAGKNRFVDGVYEALVGMPAETRGEGATPIAVLKKMGVLVTAMNIKRVRSAVERLIGIDTVPGLGISGDGRIRVHQSPEKH